MRKFLFFIFAASLLVFSCKSQPKAKETVEESVETPSEVETVEAPTEAPVVEAPAPVEAKKDFTIVCPADMSRVDSLMAQTLSEVADAIEELKPETVTFVGHSAKMDTERLEEKSAETQVKLIIEYLESVGALENVKDIVVQNKGATEPVVSHSDISGRTQNRRVQIYLQ